MKVASVLLLLACSAFFFAASFVSADPSAVTAFADANWNCANAACTSKVAVGQGQPNYQCAEFVSRSLAAGGYIPGIGPHDSQNSYLNYKHNGVAYDLLWVSSKQGGPKGLEDLLKVLGWTTVPNNQVQAGYALMLVGAEGAFSHTAVGVANGLTDAHNVAHLRAPTSVYLGINLIYKPPN
eukprot:TRINITY_DN28_c0_g1_i2.p1 TRINITY_DN28_c0_g1~~TRINITY_DN28_c0_g1_i2.p1  ORF type:complete len:204 (+),score=33.29 TRINITY_DN28_c0_g1_i2:70-612(+)